MVLAVGSVTRQFYGSFFSKNIKESLSESEMSSQIGSKTFVNKTR